MEGNPNTDLRWIPRKWEGDPQYCCNAGFTTFDLQAQEQSFTVLHKWWKPLLGEERFRKKKGGREKKN